jgi:phospholipid/cholesterol/gamma-HCH transport system substrate-binding protein
VGTVLTGAATEQPVNFDLAVQTLDPETRADIRRFLIGLGAAFANRGRDIDESLQYSSEAVNETANLVADVNSDGEALRVLVDQGARLTASIASSPDDIGGAAAETATLLAATGRRQAELAEAVRLLGPGLSGGRQALDQLAASTPRLNELVSELTPVAKELKPFAKELPHTVKAAGPFLNQTRKLVKGGPKDLRKLDPIIRAAAPIATDFPPVIENATPLAKDLTAYIPETIGFFQNFGAATGSYDKVGHLVNLATGLAQTLPGSTSGAKIDGDECTPGALKPPYTRLPGTAECQPWLGYQDAFDDIDPKNGD